MTLVKRGALSGLQVYLPGAVSQWTRKQLIIRNPPPWVLGVENLSGPQLKACWALAKAAHDYAYGKRGKVKYKGLNLPISAAIVAEAVPKGAKVHGGRTRAERAEERHLMAEVMLSYLEALAAQKGATPLPTLRAPSI
jgi:hypothetical protein